MERALLVLAVSSLLMLWSVEATRPVMSSAEAPESDRYAMINNKLNKIKSEAQLAAATFDRIAQDQSGKDGEDFSKNCGDLYKQVIEISTRSAKSDDKIGLEMLLSDLDFIPRLVDDCDSPGTGTGLEYNPAMVYEKSIKELTLEAMSLCRALAGPKVNYDIE